MDLGRIKVLIIWVKVWVEDDVSDEVEGSIEDSVKEIHFHDSEERT